MQMAIEIKIDESILLSLKAKKHEFSQMLCFYTALALYRQHKLSLGKAAKLAGYSRLDFIDKLRLEKQSIFDYETELTHEMIDAGDILLACSQDECSAWNTYHVALAA